MSTDVAVEFDRECTIVVDGTLDRESARELLRVAALTAAHTTTRITVDLSAVTAFTQEGVQAVTCCRNLGRRLDGNLTIRVRGGAGASAVLESLAVSP